MVDNSINDNHAMTGNEQVVKPIIVQPKMLDMKDKWMPRISMILLGVFVFFAPRTIPLYKYHYRRYSLDMIPPQYYCLLGTIMVFISLFKLMQLRLYAKHTRYIISQQRLTMESGVFSKKVANLELWRIVDIQLTQTFSQTSFGVCTIKIITTDVSEPIINIEGLTKAKGRELYDLLNNYVHNSVRTSGIMRTI